MPKDNIERAIKKGAGELEGTHYEDLIYEGYGPGGVAMLLEVLTDNKTGRLPMSGTSSPNTMEAW